MNLTPLPEGLDFDMGLTLPLEAPNCDVVDLPQPKEPDECFNNLSAAKEDVTKCHEWTDCSLLWLCLCSRGLLLLGLDYFQLIVCCTSMLLPHCLMTPRLGWSYLPYLVIEVFHSICLHGILYPMRDSSHVWTYSPVADAPGCSIVKARQAFCQSTSWWGIP